jgi:isoquinoline 1-oxidoreductase beta subunit
MTRKRQKTPVDPATRWKVTRRRFLIGAGSLGVLTFGGWIGLREGRPALIEMIEKRGAGSGKPPKSPNTWFEISPDGVSFYAPKFEMGQGIHSALAQIAAEELEMNLTQLLVKQADSSRGYDPQLMFTFGSTSVSTLFTPLREAAATLREMLREEAARQLGAPIAEIIASRGTCFARQNPKNALTYPQIVAARQGEWVVPEVKPALKPRDRFSTIGKNTPRVDVRAKLLGEPTYGLDARVEGMVYGAVARPPRYGAKLVQAAPGQAPSQPGVLGVVIDQAANFAGVVADTRSRAQDALKRLELRWEGGTFINQAELDALVTARAGEGEVIRRRGNVDSVLNNVSDGNTVLEGAYRTPLAAHAHLEPLSALAHVQPDRIDAWVATQFTSGESNALRRAIGGNRTLTIHPMQMGGSFGRKGSQTAVVEAARLSAAVGKPVHVGWTREEEFRHGFFRPPTHTLLRASLSAEGRIAGMDQHTVSGDILWSVIQVPGFVKDLLGFDFGVLSGQFTPYDVPNYRVRNRRLTLPVPTGPWRGLGLMPNTFALETFMDELAHAARRDPLQFRMDHAPNTEDGQRMKRVLEDVRDRSGWNTPAPAGRARGVAFSVHSETQVAVVAEVSVKDTSVTVHRVTVSVDAGLIVNPANASLQARGSVVMGLSSTLLEKITVKDGMVEQQNFDDYPLLTLKETPLQIDVNFVPSGDAPHGMGEPVIGPVPAAVGNAVFALTGTRLRELPLRL